MAVIPMLAYENGAAAATILSEPEDVPDVGVRQYRAEDPESHRWMFSQDLPS